jgi:hypothetical protein
MANQRIPAVKSNNSRRVEWLLFLILVIAFSYFFPRWADWSQNSRLDLTLAIVDKGTLSIDDYYTNTGDYALFEGVHYTDKAPGPSLLAVPVYAALRPILRSAPMQSLLERVANNPAFAGTLEEGGTGLQTEKIYNAAVLYVITFATSVIPSAILGVWMFSFLLRIGTSEAWSALIVLIYGLGTSAFAYAGAFFSHQLVAFLLFGAFYIGFRLHRREISPRWVAAAGLMMGYALISEYPTFLIAAGIFLYIVFVLWNLPGGTARRWIAGLIAGGIPPGLILIAYDMAIFNNPLPIGYTFSENYTELHSTGFLSLTLPHLDALLGITFSTYRGLFFVAPVLLLAVIGFWLWGREGKTTRGAWAVCLWATVAFILFNGSSIMWEGGWSIGPRYLVPMLPFLAVALGAFARRWGALLWARVLVAVLTVWSVFVVWAETIAGQNYPGWDTNPLTNISLPLLASGDVARNLGMIVGLKGLATLIPLIVVLLVMFGLLVRELPKKAP